MSKTEKTPKPGNKRIKKIDTLQAGASAVPATPPPEQAPSLGAISEAEQKKIQEMLLHAQLEFNKVKTNIVKEKRREIETLNSQIKEFVGPFMLLGYDLNGNPIEMVSASSPSEHDALLERLRRVMFKINQNIVNTGGTDPYGLNSN